MAARKGKIIIGCSGWHYKHWVGNYYPEGMKPQQFLEHYLQDFKTVELNAPFYHLPPKKTFESWKKQTPRDFIFSVKASRYISHQKKLQDSGEALTYFLENASGLGHKLGPVLFQLPPGWKVNYERLEAFLNILPKGFRYTFEFRNETWYTPDVVELLKNHNIAFCIYHLAGHLSPEHVTADFVYIRLHGPGGKYQGSYTERDLKSWAEKIKEWTSEGKDVYCYFDNDQDAYAAFNAQRLLTLAKEETRVPKIRRRKHVKQ